MKRYVAFFDLDKTILSASSGRLFVGYSRDRNIISGRELLYGIMVSAMHRAGFINTENIIKKWVMKYKGVPEERMKNLALQFFHELMVKYIREEIIAEINAHKKNNAVTSILSASTVYICEPVKEYLAMDESLCTSLEVSDGLFTGLLSGAYCYGKEKLNRAAEYCAMNGFSLSDAFYYADSYADFPVLEKVGNPVCVSPDRRLTKAALNKGWRICALR